MLEFTVPGEPKPQGSKRGFVTRHGKVALVEQAGKPLKHWREAVTMVATAARIKHKWEAYAQGPIGVELTFTLRKPLKPKWVTPAVRPDIDKLTRAVLDAITAAHVWQDDSQVVWLKAEKLYGSPGVSVKLWKIQ